MAASSAPATTGVQIALELNETIKGKQGVSGVHIMAVGWEEIVPRIVKDANLLPEKKTEAR
jgi:methylenetetrahydrofolate reductase (NADPH)